MKILFVYPSIADSGFNVNKKPTLFRQIHPGFCLLSAVCKKEGFKDISLIDLRALRDWNEFRDCVKKRDPDVVGITMTSTDFKNATRCIEIIKEVNAHIKIVVGGIHPTIRTSEVLANNKIDYIITGEGEISFSTLLHSLKQGKAVDRVIKGERPSDISKLPLIDRELFDCIEMPHDFFLPLPFVRVLAGRGCSYNCKFCSPIGKLMHGTATRRRTVDNIIEELKYLRDVYGFKSFMFWDDCFTEDSDWVMEFCDKYKRNGFSQPFVCQTRADIICNNINMMKKLKKAGLVMAAIGFESGSDRILTFINKGTTVKQNLKAARICKQLGIKIWGFHMFGIPTETSKDAEKTVKAVRKIKPYRSSVAFFTPYIGSTFFDYCKKHDLLLIDDYDNFVTFPEIDKPKIKNIDYKFMRKMAIKAKKICLIVKIRIRIERLFAHKKNKRFRIKFEEEVKRNPSLNKMAVLRLAHKANRV